MPIEGTTVGGLDGSSLLTVVDSCLRLAVDSCLLYMHMLPAVVVTVDDNEDARLMKRPLYTRVLSRSVYDDEDNADDDGDKKKALISAVIP